MTSSPNGAVVTARVSSSLGAARIDRFARPGFDSRRLQSGESSEATALNRPGQPLVDSAEKQPRILLVGAVLALHELHLMLLRSIPAVVEILASYAEIYLHEEHAHALVILVPHPQSRETAEAAHFVRRRWNAAKTLLIGSEPEVIDDWLYDERVDPQLPPATMREATIRLMTEESC